ncbi:Similar to Arntl: Aryl hydrocarbon receptor nuclear translocator-like protein 1 (Mus musculus) [Cotesia congregata]|uniref:Similar to Arntl: Aryl hydrocarbon receptor nuclear translocator-like protein 1 (Mus musculus) n=1 Tax=Cotesia congregata TaxID=51543 RepID=A0A8J2H7H0_COTCN|nr:Similar to Arntl: Aryl hydrocarbon receptor nuclear translocator-like protein 1 (Mus musculus) [Cotesia congregata]
MMAALVPNIASSSKRHDKISILRLAAAYLRSNFAIGPGIRDFIPLEYSDIDLEENFVDGFDGTGSFLLVVTITGNIVYISPRVEGPLGYSPVEMMGKSIFSYVHPEDHSELSKALTPDEYVQPVKKIAYYNEDCSTNEETTNTSSNSTAVSTITNNNNSNINHNSNSNFKEQRRSFYVKIAQRTNSRGEHTQFKCFHVSGVLRLADFLRKKNNSENSPAVAATSNDIIFTGIAKVIHKRITELSLYEANKQEYITRHLVDGRIVFSDHRIALVAGYMSEEVSGVNAFRFMHKDDVMWAITALRQMYDRREGFGTSCYRLLSKSGKFIYLRTHGWLEFDNKTGTFESFICVNTLVEKDEGENLIKELRNRFSATVTQISATSAGTLTVASSSSVSALSPSLSSSSSTTSSSSSYFSPCSPPKFGLSPDLSSSSAAVTTTAPTAVVPTSTTSSSSLSTATPSTPASVGTLKKSPSQSEQNVEDPTQLEDAIYQLISTLKSPTTASNLSPPTSDIECNPEIAETTSISSAMTSAVPTPSSGASSNLYKLFSADNNISKVENNKFEDDTSHKNKRIKTELSNSIDSSINQLNGYDNNRKKKINCHNSTKLLNNSEKKLTDDKLIINDKMLSLNSQNLLFSGNKINNRLMKNNVDINNDDGEDNLKQSNNIYLKYNNGNVNKNEQEATTCVKIELNGIGIKRPGEDDKRKDKRRHISISSSDQVNNLIVVKNNELIVNKLKIQEKKFSGDDNDDDRVIHVNQSNNLIIDNNQVDNDKKAIIDNDTLFNIDNHINGQSEQFGQVKLIYNEKDCETIKNYQQLKSQCQSNIINNFKDDSNDYTI